MRMITYLPQNKHRFALLLVLVLAYCACLANTSVKSDVYRQLYGKSMMQAFAVAQAYETKGDKTKALAAYSAVACRYAAETFTHQLVEVIFWSIFLVLLQRQKIFLGF